MKERIYKNGKLNLVISGSMTNTLPIPSKMTRINTLYNKYGRINWDRYCNSKNIQTPIEPNNKTGKLPVAKLYKPITVIKERKE